MAEGVKISQLYEKTLEFMTSKDQNLKNHISDTLGHGIGFEFVNKCLSISPSNDKKIQAGMVFNIILSLTNLKNEKGQTYSLQIADTVCLKSASTRENYTIDVSKNLAEIFYNMENEEEEKNGKEASNKMMVDETNTGRRTRRQTNNSNEDKLKELKNRKDHQQELLKRKNDEFKERIERNNNLNEEVQVSKKMLNSVKSYTNKAQIPHDIKPGKIYVDVKNDTVILPIFKMMVPFHVSLIKNVSKSEENSFSFLRINFHTPISGTNHLSFGDLNMNQPVFIKDLSYKSKDHKNTANLSKTIKDMIQKLKRKDQEELVKSDLVTQENLILMKGRKIGLSEVTIRPNITNKKTTGYLEAHTNGFRFVASKGDSIDIIYKNIKHAFFQPCENELIVLIHFHLHNPILVGRKKTLDVQFYREAGSQADDLHMGRRGNDYEEYESELKERQVRDRINDEFMRFTQQVQENCHVEFDIPYRDLAFSGVPYKSSITLLPTVNCLVSLIELPFFVIALEELEMIYFERVSVSHKIYLLTLNSML
jgi:nucleosome binding factor SPN SPT16 subunit